MTFWAEKRVLVPGGGGFIGSHVVERLATLGAEILVPLRPGKSYPNLRGLEGRITRLDFDLAQPADLAPALAGVSQVLYLAARTGGVAYGRTRHAQLAHENLQPFLSVLDAAQRAGVAGFLTASSACVYPEDAPVPTPEAAGDTGLPQPSNEGYGMAKRMQEYLTRQYSREYGLRGAVVRLFNVYGPRDHLDPESAMFIPALLQRIAGADTYVTVWGTGAAVRPFLYVDDCVDAILAAAERVADGEPVNIAAPEGTSVRALTELAIHLMNRPDLRIVFDAEKPEGTRRRLADTRRAASLLGFAPKVELEEGLRRTIAWLQADGSAGRTQPSGGNMA